jgi:hypothetical protein
MKLAIVRLCRLWAATGSGILCAQRQRSWCGPRRGCDISFSRSRRLGRTEGVSEHSSQGYPFPEKPKFSFETFFDRVNTRARFDIQHPRNAG